MNRFVVLSIVGLLLGTNCLATQLLTEDFIIFGDDFSLDSYIPRHPLADNSTYGNIEEIHTTHFHLDWDIDFEKSKIKGTITHDLNIVSNSTRVLQIDAWDIDV